MCRRAPVLTWTGFVTYMALHGVIIEVAQIVRRFPSD